MKKEENKKVNVQGENTKKELTEKELEKVVGGKRGLVFRGQKSAR